MDITNEHIGLTLYHARSVRNLSSEEVAEMIGVDPTTYRKYESGAIDLKNCPLFRICKICTALNLTIEELVDADYLGEIAQNSDVKRLIDVYCSIDSKSMKDTAYQIVILLSKIK